jgi:hypothetical protein
MLSNTTSRPRLAALTLALIATVALAQNQPADDSPESQQNPDPETRASLGLPRIPADAPVVLPSEEDELEPVAPGLTQGQDWLSGLSVNVTGLPQPSRLPEGMVLRERPGTIWPGPGDLWIFLPDAEGRLPGEGAMLIAPSGTRDRMTALLEGRQDGQTMIVSGQILFYHDNNYLLISSYRKPTAAETASAEVEPTDETPTDANEDPSTTVTPPPTEVEDLIRDLTGQTRATSRRGDAIREKLLAATQEASASAGPAGFPPVVEDGTYLAQRRTRLTRSADGSWMLRFDGDSEGLGDGNLTVIPSRILMLMEKRVGRTPETAMIVSGRVYTSGGKGYFLPAVFRLEVRTGINPIQ